MVEKKKIGIIAAIFAVVVIVIIAIGLAVGLKKDKKEKVEFSNSTDHQVGNLIPKRRRLRIKVIQF